ncbi:MAG TPA: M28 family peptidase [Gemmatimonadaceae bacterium]|nr:M28 family peptidase [Gemmatimonadaceae bacterium]
MPFFLRTLGLAAASSVLLTATARAQGTIAQSKIAAGEIDANLKFLSSDLLEGRAPATKGGQLASAYIASALQEAGVAAGGPNHSYFQSVPIDIVAADPATLHVTASGKATAALRYPDDVVVGAGSAVESSAAHGELVFVGYGVTAPEHQWDDFKGVDVRGKVLLVLVNDPPVAPFTKTMDYYGRWTYKYEEAERHGAAGCLIVHTTERAGYPWHTVVGSWAKELRMLPRDPSLPPPLGVRGWITDSAANSLLASAGLDLSQLRSQAASKDFRPVATGITMDMAFANHVRHMQSDNVIGVVKGTTQPEQYVVFSAHWDHLGIGPAVNGDSIYNGAEDNASGVADVLAMARAAKPQKRSMMFLFVTAEESGLLGSAWFAQHPTVPVSGIVANLNIDGGNLLGRVRDLNALGEHKSSLGTQLAKYVAPMGMHLTPDAHPEQGHFYRSDHFSFAKVGVPALSIGAGNDYIGRPKTWGVEQEDDYTAHRYHQPSDEYRPDFDLSGAVQLSTIVLGFGESLANAPGLPTWNADAEFHRQTAGSPAAIP